MRSDFFKLPRIDELLSPRGFLKRAAVLTVVFAVFHVAGLREMTSFLCGMAPMTGGAAKLSALMGLGYVVSYLGFIVIVPILVIASALLLVSSRIWPVKPRV
ncbi:MAG: hypothetical protein E4H02_11155 [Lentisphaerales bacterium]|jgi:hypothetical protein|nr:MAG: hypothetical protein E4H02_11155 [Lentisphaerales bacterium]